MNVEVLHAPWAARRALPRQDFCTGEGYRANAPQCGSARGRFAACRMGFTLGTLMQDDDPAEKYGAGPLRFALWSHSRAGGAVVGALRQGRRPRRGQGA